MTTPTPQAGPGDPLAHLPLPERVAVRAADIAQAAADLAATWPDPARPEREMPQEMLMGTKPDGQDASGRLIDFEPLNPPTEPRDLAARIAAHPMARAAYDLGAYREMALTLAQAGRTTAAEDLVPSMDRYASALTSALDADDREQSERDRIVETTLKSTARERRMGDDARTEANRLRAALVRVDRELAQMHDVVTTGDLGPAKAAHLAGWIRGLRSDLPRTAGD